MGPQILTARIRSMGEGNSFSLFVSSHPGVPHVHPIIVPLVSGPLRTGERGVAQVRSGRGAPCGTPPPPVRLG